MLPLSYRTTGRDLHRLIITLFLLTLGLGSAVAQQPDSTFERFGSTRYLVAFPDTVPNDLDIRYPNTRVRPEASIWIFSWRDNRVKIRPHGGSGTTLTLRAGQFKEYRIPDSAVVNRINTPVAKAYEIESDYPVIVYCYFAHIQGLEAWTPMPVERWGMSYRAAALPGEVVLDIGVAGETEVPVVPKAAPAEILIIAAHDDTRVTITPPSGVELMGDPPRTFTLNAGEVYQVKSMVAAVENAGSQHDIAATRIESNRPIGVISGNTRAMNYKDDVGLKNNAYKNMMVEWLRPAEQYGKEFVYMPTWDNHRPGIGAAAERTRENVRIYTRGDGTVHGHRKVAGSEERIEFVVDKDSMMELTFERPTAIHISVDVPAQMMMHSSAIIQFNGSTPCFRGIPCLSYSAWAPYMVELTPRDRWTSFAPYYAPVNPGGMQHYINVVTDTGSALKILTEKGTRFLLNRRIPGTDLVWGSMSVSQGEDHWLSGKDGARFAGYLYGIFQGGEEYRPGRTRKRNDDHATQGGDDADAPSALHPCEYEEYNALSYGYPLISSPESRDPSLPSSVERSEADLASTLTASVDGDRAVIRYTLGRAGMVRVKIYDAAGREVATLVDEGAGAGQHVAHWNAAGHPSGVYFCAITAGAWSRSVPIVIAR